MRPGCRHRQNRQLIQAVGPKQDLYDLIYYITLWVLFNNEFQQSRFQAGLLSQVNLVFPIRQIQGNACQAYTRPFASLLPGPTRILTFLTLPAKACLTILMAVDQVGQ
jgi:hypothetical protein